LRVYFGVFSRIAVIVSEWFYDEALNLVCWLHQSVAVAVFCSRVLKFIWIWSEMQTWTWKWKVLYSRECHSTAHMLHRHYCQTQHTHSVSITWIVALTWSPDVWATDP